MPRQKRTFDPRKNLTQPDGTPIPSAPPAAEPPPVVGTPGVIIRAHAPIEPLEQTIGQDNPRMLSATGDSRAALEPALIEPVDRAVDPEKMAMMAFMNDNIKIHVHSTNNKEEEQIFELFINGERQVFRRNEHKVVPRRFVDLMARLKQTTFTQRTAVDQNGVKGIENLPSTGLRYPFSVIEDPHPRGREWMQSVLAEA